MRLNTDKVARRIRDFYSFKNQLSETGKQSISCKILENVYQTASHHYQIVSECLNYYRDESDQVCAGNSQTIEPPSGRLQHELTCLVTTLLKNMPTFDIDKLLNQDPEVTEKDKSILKEATDLV